MPRFQPLSERNFFKNQQILMSSMFNHIHTQIHTYTHNMLAHTALCCALFNRFWHRSRSCRCDCPHTKHIQREWRQSVHVDRSPRRGTRTADGTCSEFHCILNDVAVWYIWRLPWQRDRGGRKTGNDETVRCCEICKSKRKEKKIGPWCTKGTFPRGRHSWGSEIRYLMGTFD